MKIKLIEHSDVHFVTDSLSHISSNSYSQNYEDYILLQIHQNNPFWMIVEEGKFAGHISLIWNSLYHYFYENKIPEIADVMVLPAYQRRGYATKLMDTAEAEAKKMTNKVGLGVGLSHSYGPAQNLYLKRGYKFDGNGMTYHQQYVQPGEHVIVGDNLALWMIKDLT